MTSLKNNCVFGPVTILDVTLNSFWRIKIKIYHQFLSFDNIIGATCHISEFAVYLCIIWIITFQIFDLVLVQLLMRTVPLIRFHDFNIKSSSISTTCTWFERMRDYHVDLQAIVTSWSKKDLYFTKISCEYFSPVIIKEHLLCVDASWG